MSPKTIYWWKLLQFNVFHLFYELRNFRVPGKTETLEFYTKREGISGRISLEDVEPLWDQELLCWRSAKKVHFRWTKKACCNRSWIDFKSFSIGFRWANIRIGQFQFIKNHQFIVQISKRRKQTDNRNNSPTKHVNVSKFWSLNGFEVRKISLPWWRQQNCQLHGKFGY